MEEFDHVLKEMLPHYNRGQWELAQQVLEKFAIQKGDDIAPDLRQKCERWTAQICTDAGKPDLALAIYQRHYEDTAEDDPQFILVVMSYVKMLNATNRASKAVEVLEKVLSRPLALHMQDSLSLMAAYRNAVQKVQDQFLEISRTLLPTIIEALALQESVKLEILAQPDAMIDQLTIMHKAGNRRFAGLMVLLPNLQTAAERDAAVQSFIDSESIGYYRDMAKDYLSNAS
jgi:hypothetical protein